MVLLSTPCEKAFYVFLCQHMSTTLILHYSRTKLNHVFSISGSAWNTTARSTEPLAKNKKGSTTKQLSHPMLSAQRCECPSSASGFGYKLMVLREKIATPNMPAAENESVAKNQNTERFSSKLD